jgi:hypothetical protein
LKPKVVCLSSLFYTRNCHNFKMWKPVWQINWAKQIYREKNVITKCGCIWIVHMSTYIL